MEVIMLHGKKIGKFGFSVEKKKKKGKKQMKNSEEKRVEKNISNADVLDNISDDKPIHEKMLEEKIIEETYKAIEYDENCKMIAVEYRKKNNIKAKIKDAFNFVKRFFSELVKKNEDKKEEIKKEKIVIKVQDKMYDPNAETIKIQRREINNRLLEINYKEFEQSEIKSVNGNSGPIFYSRKENLENITTKNPIENNSIKYENREYTDLPNIDGKNRSDELER